jgi:hypothetical protein
MSKALQRLGNDSWMDPGLKPDGSPTTKRLQGLEFQANLERFPGDSNIGYSARVWTQVSLPYRDPGDVSYWERRNGPIALTMRPALLTALDGTRYEAYAYGLLPRHILTWISSEAVRTQDPTLVLGRSMSAFMAKIKLAKGGRDAARLTDQLRRLLGSNLSIQGMQTTEASGHGEVTKYFQIADEFQLWFTKNSTIDETSTGLWNSEIKLNPSFFHSIVDAPIPVNLDAIAALGKSPMSMDIYLWATYRVYNLRGRTVKIPWGDLNQQFGGQYKQARQFKAQFVRNLATVKVVYPELNIEPTQDYLILRPSPTHVPVTKLRRLELI